MFCVVELKKQHKVFMKESELLILGINETPKYERKPSGHILINNVEVAVTLACVHCGHHFVSIRGSGKIRGFCLKCYGITCGNPACNECVPFERKIDLYEQSKIGVLK